MNFYGADTAALREQATTFDACGKTMLERTSTLSSTVMSVAWAGPDAEALRQRWTEVEQQIRSAAEDLAARSQDLAEHAEEQDSASAADSGGRSDGPWWEKFGLPDLSHLFNDSASRLSDWIGMATKLADGISGPGLGSGNPLLAALDPGTGGPSGGGKSIYDVIDDLFGAAPTPTIDKYHGDYDNPEDEFDVTPGEGGRTVSKTLAGDSGSIEVTTDADGNTSAKVEITSPLVDVNGKVGSAEASFDLDVSSSGERKDNGDGTVTYTMTSELSAEARAELSAKNGILSGGLDANGGRTASTEYEVTVPEGTSLADAMAINPFDPSSIPSGANVTFSGSDTTAQGAGANVGVLGLDLASIGAQESNGEGTSTSVGRDAEGNLTVTTGPTSEMKSTVTAQLGTDDANVSIAQSGTSKDATFETGTFNDDAAGRRAYQDALLHGKFPDDAGDGVVNTYVERQQLRTVDVTGGGKLGPMSVEGTDNMLTQETITRTYSDGHVEKAEQWSPQGDASTNSVVRSEGSGREPTYVVTMDTSGSSAQIDSAYGVSPSGDRTSIVLTESEAATIRDHARAKQLVADDATSAETLSTLMRNDVNADATVRDLESNYAVANPDGSSEPVGGSYAAPGKAFDPETQAVRDGRIVDRR